MRRAPWMKRLGKRLLSRRSKDFSSKDSKTQAESGPSGAESGPSGTASDVDSNSESDRIVTVRGVSNNAEGGSEADSNKVTNKVQVLQIEKSESSDKSQSSDKQQTCLSAGPVTVNELN